MGTLPAVQALVTMTAKTSQIEKQILEFAEVAKENGWKCDDIPAVQALGKAELKSTFSKPEGPNETTAMKAIKQFLKEDKEAWCLVLSGPKGCGKSTAAAYYLWDNTSFQVNCPPRIQRWWTAAKVARVSSYNTELENLMKTPVLVIDDLGVEYLDKNGHFNHRLDELIDARYSNFRKTIITTNLNKADFKDRYGLRITDRIREGFKHGGAYFEITDCPRSLRA